MTYYSAGYLLIRLLGDYLNDSPTHWFNNITRSLDY